MSFLETLDLYPNPNSSVTAAEAVSDFFTLQVGAMGVYGAGHIYQRRGTTYMSAQGLRIDADPESDEYERAWEESSKAGGVDKITFTLDKISGMVASARVEAQLPASLTHEQANHLFVADSTVARLQFPTLNQPERHPRVVLDAWRNPETQVSLAAGDLLGPNTTDDSERQYDALFSSVFEKLDRRGIPIGAVDKTHLVLGKDTDLNPEQQETLAVVMDNFEVGIMAAIKHAKLRIA